MNEQQLHLQQLLQRQNELIGEIQSLNSNASTSRDILLKVQGAIEYLQQIGVSLPEPDSEEVSEEVSEESDPE